jgi:hypothetical protein
MSKIGDVIDALRGKVATEYLTQPQQEDFVGKRFRNYHVTDRQFRKIFLEVPVGTGRPKESSKKVANYSARSPYVTRGQPFIMASLPAKAIQELARRI